MSEDKESERIKEELEHIMTDTSGVHEEVLSDEEKHTVKIINIQKEMSELSDLIEHYTEQKRIADNFIVEAKEDIEHAKRNLKFFRVMSEFTEKQIQVDYEKYNNLSSKLSEDIEYK